jgi:hypothetical protein
VSFETGRIEARDAREGGFDVETRSSREVFVRRPASIALFLILGLLIASCGTSSPGASVGAGASQPAVTPSEGNGQPIDETTPPAGGSFPAIVDGQYTGGKAHLEVSGGKSLTVDLDLGVAASVTTSGTTLLWYSSGSGQDLISLQVIMAPDTGSAINLSSNIVLAVGAAENGCRISVDKNDGSGIAGTFDCPGLPGMTPGGTQALTVNVKGTYSANR